MALRHRMPVIPEEAWPLWLGEEAGDHAELLAPSAPGLVRLWPVGRAADSVRNNGADLLEKAMDVAPFAPADDVHNPA